MNTQNSIIQLKNISKSFSTSARTFTALKNIDISINQGEHVAIVGKSGSGKSTLLNLISGLDYPSEGTVIINNTDIHSLKESSLAVWRGKNVGIVFQFFQLIPTLTILENLLLAMDFVNVVPKKLRIKRAEELLNQTGILPQAGKLPFSLSGGEQQRAAIARALANDPPIIVADEPTGNLDSKTSDVILKLFTGLIDKGKTVIVVTHENIKQNEYSRIITLADGLVIDDSRLIKQTADTI